MMDDAAPKNAAARAGELLHFSCACFLPSSLTRGVGNVAACSRTAAG